MVSHIPGLLVFGYLETPFGVGMLKGEPGVYTSRKLATYITNGFFNVTWGKGHLLISIRTWKMISDLTSRSARGAEQAGPIFAALIAFLKFGSSVPNLKEIDKIPAFRYLVHISRP